MRLKQMIIAGLAAGAIVTLSHGGAQAQSFDPALLVTPLEAGRAGPTVTALKAENVLNIVAEQQIPPAFDLPAASVSIEFDRSTAMLTANGIDALGSVAAALRDPRLSGQTFQVGAHFVAVDNPSVAQRVSSVRAQRVVEHLVAFHQINPAQLIPVGYGASKLADPQNFASPVNTRIEFINILR